MLREPNLEHMRRRVAAARSAAAQVRGRDTGELAQAAWIEGVTTGALERAALRLAESMAPRIPESLASRSAAQRFLRSFFT